MEEAQSYLGTPFAHQGRTKGLGVDCLGLVVGVANNVGIDTSDDETNYGPNPSGTRMVASLKKHMKRVPMKIDRKPGDVALMRWGRPGHLGPPQHIAFIGSRGDHLTLIHAAGQFGKVVEHRLTADWEPNIVAIYRHPELED